MLRNVLAVAFSVCVLSACDGTTAEQHLQNARARMDEGEVRTAVIELKNALQKAPDLAAARLLLGEAHSRLGDHPSALKEFERALDLGLDGDRVERGLLDSKVQLGRYREVIGALEGREQLTPELSVVLGNAYLRAGDLAGAQAMFERGANADLAEGSLGLALVAWQRGDTDAASHHFEQAVAADGQNVDTWLRSGEFELSRRNLTAAEEDFGAAVELPAGRVLGLIGLVRADLLQGDLEGADDRVSRLQKLAPELPVGHYLGGLIRFELGDMEGAESEIREVQSVAPDHAPSMYLMGAIKYRQGQLAQAEDSLQRYVAQEPGSETGSKVLASVAFDRGNYQRVVETLEPFAESTRDPQLLAMFGAAQLRLGAAADATRALERAVDLAPDQAPFRNQLALSMLATGDHPGAEAELASAIEVDSDQFQSEYLLALMHLQSRDFDKADAAVEAMIGKNPESPVGYNLRGALALARGDGVAARRAFEAAVNKDRAFLPAIQNLARLAKEAGDDERGRTLYESFLEGNPGHEGALIALAELALGRDDGSAAAGYLRRAVEADAGAVRARLGLARMELADGRVDAAADLVDEALIRAPQLADLLLLRAEIDLRRGDRSAAGQHLAELQRRVLAEPDNATLRFAVGQLQSRAGDLELAEENLSRGTELADTANAVVLRELTRIALRQGDAQKARERLDELQAVDDGPASKLLEADVLLAEGRTEQAQRVLTTLAEDGVRDAVLQLAAIELRKGESDVAIARLESWADANPEDLGAGLLLADVLMRKDQNRAVARYEVLAGTGNPIALNNLAWLYSERDDPRAVDTARRAASAAPNNADVLDTLGWVLLKQGEDADEAVQILQRSAELNPDNPSIQYHLGVALSEIGDVAAARAALTRALESGDFPEADEARNALQDLPSA